MKTFKASSQRIKAFTLIELLVVISIIALLIGILLPALSAARKTAQDMQSLSNSRQMVIGLVSYSLAFNDFLPYGEFDINNNGTITQGNWALSITGYISGSNASYQSGDEESEVFIDPRAGVDGGTLHYSAHPLLMPDLNGGNFPDRPAKLPNVARPTELFTVASGTQITEWTSDPNGVTGNAFSTVVNLFGWQSYLNSGTQSEWYLKNDSTDSDSIAYTGPTPDDDLPEWGGGNIRWRNGAGDSATFNFLDGHASIKSREDVIYRNIRLSRNDNTLPGS